MSGTKYVVYSHLDTQENKVPLRADGGNEELVCPGKLRIGSTDDPTRTCDITGTLGITGNTVISGDISVDTNTLVVDSTNNRVGINKTTPTKTLDVVGDMEITDNSDILGTLTLTKSGGSTCLNVTADATIGGNLSSTGSLVVATNTLTVDATNNRVGIGTATPRYGKLDVIGQITESSDTLHTTHPVNQPVTSGQVTIAGEYGIRSKSVGFLLDSDSRIKKDIQDISDGTALNLIRQLQPKTYKYKNTNVSESVYGFLAQDVKSVLPHSVFIKPDFIPDIFRTATVTNGNTLTLTAHGLTLGASISLKNPDKIVRIISVPDADTFTIDETLNVEEVTVYGTFVQDYHTLNKDAIWTVSTAALQEVDRQLEAEKTKAAALETKYETLKQDLATIKAHIGL